ncbi:MAG: hypothetical protein CBE14_001375 [Rickettsiales bacterium TMED254]|nr:MAG: hypothetical protein CBE14_001375 [Rickettsiales bacterium TMED254]
MTNQYINNYHYQEVREQKIREIEKLNDYQLTKYNQAQYREQQRWLVYIMMMQLMFKYNMWDTLNQMRIRRRIDLTA